MTLPVRTRILLWLLAFVTLALLYGPLLVTFVLSFFSRTAGRIRWDSFSLEWYRKLLDNDELKEAVLNSVAVGAVATAIATVFGTVFALYCYNRANKLRLTLQWLVFLPFVLPPIITGLSLLIFFREMGVARSLVTVVIGHTLFVLALVYRIALTRLLSLDSDLVEAAADLGSTRLQTFWYITLPGLRSALIASAVLAFALSFDETLITIFLVGGDSTLPIRLWGMMRVGFTPEINALVTLLIVMSTGLFLLVAGVLLRNKSLS